MNDIEPNRRDERFTRMMILREKHREIHKEADVLSSRRFLFPAEKRELKSLKVMKLRLKDAMERLNKEITQDEST